MRPSILSFLRTALLALGCAVPMALVHAQDASQAAPADARELQNQEQTDGRYNQRIEHITVEDRGARVDELRYGGRTQSITVTPKASDMPAYEVMPDAGGRSRQGPTETSSSGNGPRVWNVLKF